MWSRIYDVILKSLISGEHYVQAGLKKHNTHRNNCFEIFGYDILLDSDLKPWLVEVNLSPSLACESPMDLTIKTNLIADTFNMIGVKRFDRRKESQKKIKKRAQTGMSMSRSNNQMNTSTGFGAGMALPNLNKGSNDIFLSQQSLNP